MHIESFILVGAGGHAKVVFDAAVAAGVAARDITVVDDNRNLDEAAFLSTRITPGGSAAVGIRSCHVAIGRDSIRRDVHQKLASEGATFRTICHPAAMIASSATIGQGTFIAAGAVVGPDSQVGEGVIINHGAVVDHDCIVAPFSHIAPNATLGGGVTIGAGVLVGAGAIVLPSLNIGEGAVIAAGAVIVRDVPAGRIMMSAVAARDRQGN